MALTTDFDSRPSSRGRRIWTRAVDPVITISATTTSAVDVARTAFAPAGPSEPFLATSSGATAVEPSLFVASSLEGVAGKPNQQTWNQRYVRRLVVTDALVLIGAGVGVHLITVPSISTAVSGTPGHLPFIVTAGIVIAWLAALTWVGSRDVKAVGIGPVEYKRVIHATFGFCGLVAIGSFLLQLDLPRKYLLILMPVGLIALLASRYLWRRWLQRRRRDGLYVSRVLAVGDRHTVTELVRDLERAPRAGYRVVGVCLAPELRQTDRENPTTVEGVPILGGLDDVVEIARSCEADSVAVTSSGALGSSRVRTLSWELIDSAAELILAPALSNIAGPRVHTHPVAGLPLIHVDRPTYRGANRTLKKSFDIVGSAAMLLMFSPFLLAIAIAIKVSSPGPVFFRQDRVGINGTIFRMIKFRSMVVDAETRLLTLKDAHRDAGNVVLFKMKNDPRVTGVGKFIRRYSIDELPQLFNVLMGDMSLVGPRPPLKAEVDGYEADARRRLLVKPGMTGLWQVSGRSDLTWDDSVRLDLYYVENWSITGDLTIICKTAKAVLSSSGAY